MPIALDLKPFEYHIKVRDHFKSRKKTWDWFAQKSTKENHTQKVKADLLKNSYRLPKERNEKLYNFCKEISEKLSINPDVTLYQVNGSIELNAGISILGNEAHIVFSGPILNILNDAEIKSVLAHELAHFLFNKMDNEELEVTQRIILALANNDGSSNGLIETARLFQLYIELYCDKCSLMVSQDYKPVISALVKLDTGLTEVDADSFMNQTKEILQDKDIETLGNSHPESYIRSVAIWYKFNEEKDYHLSLHKLINGKLDLNALDIFDQQKMREYTDVLIQAILKPKWMNSSNNLNLAKQFFPEFSKKEKVSLTEKLKDILKASHHSIVNYFTYILLDFSQADSTLESMPIAHCAEIAEQLDIKVDFEKKARKELKFSAKDFKSYMQSATQEMNKLNENSEDSIYTEE